MIEVRDLKRFFGNVRAVDGVSFTVKRGQSVALWGHNGAGKTTIIRCLLGAFPFSGQATVDGHDALRAGRAARACTGFVPQDVRFYDNLTVAETIAFFSRLRRVSGKRAGALMEQMGLSEFSSRRARALSGGVRQRLALAVALLSDPSVLLLDEPTSNLDAAGRSDFVRFLGEQRRSGRTILFSSHRMREVGILADRVLVMENGQLKTDCPPERVAESTFRESVLRVYVDTDQIARALSVLERAGLTASKNGVGIKVRTEPHRKADAVSALVHEGISVNDIDVVEPDEEGQPLD